MSEPILRRLLPALPAVLALGIGAAAAAGPTAIDLPAAPAVEQVQYYYPFPPTYGPPPVPPRYIPGPRYAPGPGYYDDNYGPPRRYQPDYLPPGEVIGYLRSQGYGKIQRPKRVGRTYVVFANNPKGAPVQVTINAIDGRVLKVVAVVPKAPPVAAPVAPAAPAVVAPAVPGAPPAPALVAPATVPPAPPPAPTDVNPATVPPPLAPADAAPAAVPPADQPPVDPRTVPPPADQPPPARNIEVPPVNQPRVVLPNPIQPQAPADVPASPLTPIPPANPAPAN